MGKAEPAGVNFVWGRRESLTAANPKSRRRLPFTLASPLLFSILFAARAGPSGTLASAEIPPIPGHPPRVITSARASHDLSNEEAIRAIPVHLRGVITYFDPDFGSGQPAIFFHDATGNVFIKMLCKLTCKAADPLFVGALVDVHGVSAPGGFGPVVGNPQIRVLGRAPLPQNPPQVTLAELRTGAEDAQWVQVEGSVHQVTEYANSVTLRLEMADGPIDVTMIKTPGATYSGLVDAQVRILANAAPTTNSDVQMVGVHLQSPNISSLQVLEPAPKDPYAQSPIPIDGLLHREHFSTPMHRVHLRGTVTLQWPGSLLCLREATHSICAESSQATPVSTGDLVDLAGFVETQNSVPVITNAVFRSSGNNRPLASRSVTAHEILAGGFGFELVQIDGQLIGYDLASSDAILQLSSGDTLFPAILPKSLAGPNVRAWKIGSRVRVTGICSVQVDTQGYVRLGQAVTKSFRILMRSPADVTILEEPSWWTPVHATILLALALTATLTVLGWVVALRRRVEQQANLLRESEQKFRHMALHDALTGLATRVLLQDRLEVALEVARRRCESLAVLMVDLDKFKEINDSFGHLAGDHVLRITSSRLLKSARKADTVARLGGDEFAVLLQDFTDPEAAKVIAGYIVESLAVPVSFEGQEIPISVSVGVCVLPAEECDTNDLMKNADAALYEAKASGRNCFRVYKLNPSARMIA
jgi:diguanylate cyclase (GGDEF)-like protein